MAKVTGEGSIIQMEKDKPKSKCRKWQLRVPIGLDPRTGKYKTRTRRVSDMNFTQAKKALRDFIEELEHDEVQGRASYTFEEYCQRFLEVRAAKKEVAATTLKRQEWQFKAACRHIGKANLASITPSMLDDMYIAMLNLGRLKETKTKAGMRLLPLPEVTRDALLAQKEAQAAQFAKTNQWRKPEEGYLEQAEDTPVISTHYGERVTPGSLSRWWSLGRARFGLDGWSFHELRHFYLTLLALNGVHPKVMQELAGHYSSQITVDIYTHVNMDAKKEAVAAASRVF